MSVNVRIQGRDAELIQSVIDYNGLPGKELVSKFFEGSRYGYRRLKLLEENDYLRKMYYYAPRRIDGKTISQRVSAIYYATSKACREIGCTIDPRFIVPNKDKLDVANLVGKLFLEIPNLLSRRQAAEKYNLKNFMPVTCVVDDTSPMFIYILGNKLGRFEIARVKSFIESGIIANASHYIVSRIFHDRLFIPNTYFIPWVFAPEVLPQLAKDRDYYLKEFFEILKTELPGVKPLSQPEPLIKAQYNGQVLYIGELISGLNNIRLVLQDPPENTLIYAPSRRHFYGVKLTQGSFLFYSRQDQQIFHMLLRSDRMYSVPYQIRR